MHKAAASGTTTEPAPLAPYTATVTLGPPGGASPGFGQYAVGTDQWSCNQHLGADTPVGPPPVFDHNLDGEPAALDAIPIDLSDRTAWDQLVLGAVRLASDAASFVTGTILMADGGWTAAEVTDAALVVWNLVGLDR